MSAVLQTESGKVRYPCAVIAFFGPNDQRASKLVATVQMAREQEGPLRSWQVDEGDIRDSPAVTEEVTTFLKENRVLESIISEKVIVCPHEEGKDFPRGRVCPSCSFWWAVDQWRDGQAQTASAPARAGRNDPCPCGSGKKYKKCCGAAA